MVADGRERSHHVSIFHGPVGTHEDEEVGHIRHGQIEVCLRACFLFLGEVEPVATGDWKARAAGGVEAGCPDDGVDCSLCAIRPDNAMFGDLYYGGENGRPRSASGWH